MNMASKVFCRVILECIKTALDGKLREEQAEFRAGRSCKDQIATKRIIVEQSIEWQSSLYISFIDFEKAFVSISREVLWKLLRHYGMPIKIVIRDLYEVFTAQVVHNKQKTEACVCTKRKDGVSVEGVQVRELDKFTYLGSIVSKKGGTNEDIQARTGKARHANAMLRPKWRCTTLTTKTKLRVPGSNKKAVLLNCSEKWRLTKGLKKKLPVFINKSLSKILRIRWPGRIHDVKLWRKAKQ